ncbi:heparan-alpha-glucosaminide N-acetyltransferase [Paramormyrops kingsleyae]|uniref:heparan-alpha-glucosaminide N-acetyltransferase n=1 Tax=Paramormyrops kingsleyae TaxID=1676925 RepID=UPI003B97B34C
MRREKGKRKGERRADAGDSKGKGDSAEMRGCEGRHAAALRALIAAVLAVCALPLAAQMSVSHPGRKSTALKMDEASLIVNSELQQDVLVSWLSDHCFQCLFQPLGLVPAQPIPGTPSSAAFVLSSQHPLTLQLNSSTGNQELCRVAFHFGEQGNYSLWVKNDNESVRASCSIVTDKEPVNSYLPILVAVLVYAGLCILVAAGRTVMGLDVVRNLCCLGNTMEMDRLVNSELGSPSRTVDSSYELPATPPTPSTRLRSLDTFRGLALVIMIFVNYGGGRYWFFRHESWNGLTVADLVFPWFVFIMGTSIALSLNSALRRGSRRSGILGKALWRSVQLFVLGVLVINPNYCQGPLSWDTLRIPGVLQRLSISYLAVVALHLMRFGTRTDGQDSDGRWSSLQDILPYWPAWLCVVVLETIWLCLTFLLPVPDCPLGYLGPGGIGDFGQYPNCTGGAAGLIDRWLLGEKHIYQTPSSRVLYQSQMPYDPEGVLGSINSVVMAFLGLQAGKIIFHFKDQHSKIMSRFAIWGFILGIISAILTKCSKEYGFIPVNKNLWSLSYITTLSCFAFVILFFVYYTVDVVKFWSGAPFFYPGMNSILVYVGHEVFQSYFPFRWKMWNSQSHAEHLTQNLVATSIWVLISYLLYRKKIFWKI